MPDKTQTELEKLEQDIQNGKYRYSSPRFIEVQFPLLIEQAIRSDIEAALDAGKTEIVQDLMVIHYTSLTAVIAMLKAAAEDKGYLRMYSTSGFNDPTEGKHFADLVAKKSSYLASFLRKEKDEKQDPAFVASFIQAEPPQTTDVENDLIFWRAYGREGTGCSLKLQLDSSAAEEMRKVTYRPESTVENIKSIEKKLPHVFDLADRVVQIAMAEGLLHNHTLHSREIVNNQVRKGMEKTKYLYKDLAYQHENECRLVETSETVKEKRIETKFDYSGAQGMEVVKKYIEHPSLKLTDKVLHSKTKITVGPRVPNPADTKEYIEKLLKKVAFGAEVEISEIPYRKPFHH